MVVLLFYSTFETQTYKEIFQNTHFFKEVKKEAFTRLKIPLFFWTYKGRRGFHLHVHINVFFFFFSKFLLIFEFCL